MKTKEQVIKNFISEYNEKIENCEKEMKRYLQIKCQIRDKHKFCPTAYESDFDYQQMTQDIAMCKAQIRAYTQAKHDFDSILNYN
jgi:hypothetical protein